MTRTVRRKVGGCWWCLSPAWEGGRGGKEKKGKERRRLPGHLPPRAAPLAGPPARFGKDPVPNYETLTAL